MPDLEMHDQCFFSEVISGDSGIIDKTQGEQEKREDAQKFHEQLHEHEKPDQQALEDMCDCLRQDQATNEPPNM